MAPESQLMATSNDDSTRKAGARFPAIIQKIRSVETVTVAGRGRSAVAIRPAPEIRLASTEPELHHIASGEAEEEIETTSWQGRMGSGVVRDFRGAMLGKAHVGFVITTGSFTKDALTEAGTTKAGPDHAHGWSPASATGSRRATTASA